MCVLLALPAASSKCVYMMLPGKLLALLMLYLMEGAMHE